MLDIDEHPPARKERAHERLGLGRETVGGGGGRGRVRREEGSDGGGQCCVQTEALFGTRITLTPEAERTRGRNRGRQRPKDAEMDQRETEQAGACQASAKTATD